MANIDIIKRKLFVTSNHGQAQIVDVFINDTLYDNVADQIACKVHYIVIDEIGVIDELSKVLKFYTYQGYFSKIYIEKLLTAKK